jgi:hypothetical protein
MIATERWQAAQAAEAAWWTPTPERAAEVAAGHAWLRDLLDIRPETVAGLTVTDLGGGAVPIVGHPDLALARRVVVDPLEVTGWPAQDGVHRVVCPAEHYVGAPTDEVWVYNVLQHVLDPAAVVAVAQTHAVTRVRWFEYVETPVHTIHPHTITSAWLLDQFPPTRWQRARCAYGMDETHRWVAAVWERAA